MSRVTLNDLNDALFIFDKTKSFEVLTCSRMRYLEKKYDCHFYFYSERKEGETRMRKGELIAERKPHAIKYDKKLHFKLNEDFPTTKNGEIKCFELLLNPRLLPKRYVCTKIKNCRYETHSLQTFQRHQKICGHFNVQKITAKQTFYGGENSVLRQMADQGYIPMEAVDYENYILASFDIETIEQKFSVCAPERGMVTDANLNLLSLAVGSNIENYEPKCWVRSSMDSNEEKKIIAKFVSELEWIQNQKVNLLPNWISEGLVAIEEEILRLKAANMKWYHYSELLKFKRTLNSLCSLDIFGFNSSRFDLPVIYAPLVMELKKRFSKVSILKKGTSYISISTSNLVFKVLALYK